MPRSPISPPILSSEDVTAFDSASEVWFWFVQAQQARNEGARFKAGLSAVTRPCEPIDILKILDRLYRNRFLTRDHLLVLRHYGRRQMPPDSRRVKEARAHHLWHEALERMETSFIRKGIVVVSDRLGRNTRSNFHAQKINNSEMQNGNRL